ncbi:hypothetical protein V2W45_1327264 [Cenococcum geophilum]
MSSASNENSTIISESLDIFNDYYAYSLFFRIPLLGNTFSVISEYNTMGPKYRKGQHVRYKPVGGPNSNTSESTGTIVKSLSKLPSPMVDTPKLVRTTRDMREEHALEFFGRHLPLLLSTLSHFLILDETCPTILIYIENDNTGKTMAIYSVIKGGAKNNHTRLQNCASGIVNSTLCLAFVELSYMWQAIRC